MNLKAIGERVLVRPEPLEEITDSGIILPGAISSKTRIGTVVSSQKDELKRGDRVIFLSEGNIEITIDGEKFLIVDFDSIYVEIK